MEILRNITKDQLLEAIQDQDKCECIAIEIMKMANSFINNNKINGLDREDYAQDLFMEVWRRLDEFDSTKGTFATFCFMWFKSYRSNTIRKNKDLLLLDEKITEELTMLDTLLQEEEKDDNELQQEISSALTNASEELKLWCQGHSQQDIAIKLNITQSMVSKRINKELEQIRKSLGIIKENGVYFRQTI